METPLEKLPGPESSSKFYQTFKELTDNRFIPSPPKKIKRGNICLLRQFNSETKTGKSNSRKEV